VTELTLEVIDRHAIIERPHCEAVPQNMRMDTPASMACSIFELDLLKPCPLCYGIENLLDTARGQVIPSSAGEEPAL